MKKLFLMVISCLLCLSSIEAQRAGKRAKSASVPDTVISSKVEESAIKPGTKSFKDLITVKAQTSRGLFNVHKQEDKFFFEIPDSLLGRDLLIVSRISKAPAGARGGRGGTMGYAGDQINENVVRFEKGPNNRLFLKSISFQELSQDSSENGMYRNVMNSNLQPIVASFEIKALNYIKDTISSKKDSSYLIDVTDYCNGDNDILFFDGQVKSALKLSGLQSDKSYISTINAYALNVEIKTIKTYTQMVTSSGVFSSGAIVLSTFELNTSIVLLSKEPMKARIADSRVGYFSTGYIDFDKDPQGVEDVEMITRFRLEPKDEDIERYKRGELVEPKKQIIYYIDPTTPKKWVPYLIQGVNDWQVAFEKAGFKNAIVAKEAPTDDSTWSLDDARHNAIVYKPSAVANASGPHVHDPRSGEIIETHINWFHNVMALLHNWYMIQAAAVDPRARKMTFDDSLMGQLIRFVSSHEVGHTLGLRHNYGSSSTVPVEKLRDAAWLKEHGHTPSIMDYARFNYVAQPEDSIGEYGIFPRIGEYDKWAIQWGYRWLPEFKSASEENPLLNKWIVDSLKSNPRLWFGPETDPLDPRCQSEDLGDNSMKASAYGIKNLQRILPNLYIWTKKDNEGYADLATMYREVVIQFSRYMVHVSKNIGGLKITPKSVEQEGAVYEVIPKATQKEAMKFLQEQLFKTPEWLINIEYCVRIGSDPLIVISTLQEAQLDRLLNRSIGFGGFVRVENIFGSDVYTLPEMWNDLKDGIWSELKTHKAIDIYRKSLQKSYIDKLITIVVGPKAESGLFLSLASSMAGRYNEVPSIAKAHAKKLATEIKAAMPFTKDARSKAHLQECWEKLDEVLRPKK